MSIQPIVEKVKKKKINIQSTVEKIKLVETGKNEYSTDS